VVSNVDVVDVLERAPNEGLDHLVVACSAPPGDARDATHPPRVATFGGIANDARHVDETLR
jgi:hypothetical protein